MDNEGIREDKAYAEGYQDGAQTGVMDALADRAEIKRLRTALQDLVDALAANDEDGLTEFADVMVRARSALK